jgi:hypothetical protein
MHSVELRSVGLVEREGLGLLGWGLDWGDYNRDVDDLNRSCGSLYDLTCSKDAIQELGTAALVLALVAARHYSNLAGLAQIRQHSIGGLLGRSDPGRDLAYGSGGRLEKCNDVFVVYLNHFDYSLCYVVCAMHYTISWEEANCQSSSGDFTSPSITLQHPPVYHRTIGPSSIA